MVVVGARGGHGGGARAAGVRGADGGDEHGVLRHPAGVGDVLGPPRRRPTRRRHARQLLGHRHRLRPRDRTERRPGDAVRSGVRRGAVPDAGALPAVVADHVGRRVRGRVRAVVVHGAGAAVPAAGARGVPRRGRVRPGAGPGPLRLRLRAVPAAVPADAVRRAPARRLLRGPVRAPRRADAHPGERARPWARRGGRRRLRHVLGLLPLAARLRAALRGLRRDVEGVLCRGLQVRAAHCEARHAVRRHGLLGVLGIRALSPDRRLAPQFHSEHVPDRHVLQHGGDRVHDHVRVQRRREHACVERDRRGERGEGQERGVGDDEAVGVPGRHLRAAAGVRPRPVGAPLQRERGDRVGVRGHHAAHGGLHRAGLRAGRAVGRGQGLRLAAPGGGHQPGGVLPRRHAARHPVRLQARPAHQGPLGGAHLRAHVPGLHAARHHPPHQVVQPRRGHAGEEGQLHAGEEGQLRRVANAL